MIKRFSDPISACVLLGKLKADKFCDESKYMKLCSSFNIVFGAAKC